MPSNMPEMIPADFSAALAHLNTIEISTGEAYEIPPMSENPYATAPPFTELTPELVAGIEAGERNGDAGYPGWADREPMPRSPSCCARTVVRRPGTASGCPSGRDPGRWGVGRRA